MISNLFESFGVSVTTESVTAYGNCDQTLNNYWGGRNSKDDVNCDFGDLKLEGVKHLFSKRHPILTSYFLLLLPWKLKLVSVF